MSKRKRSDHESGREKIGLSRQLQDTSPIESHPTPPSFADDETSGPLGRPRVMLRAVTEPADSDVADAQQRRPTPVDGHVRLPDRYHLASEVARGGMGAVLRGHDRQLGRDVAIKVILRGNRDQREMVDRFVEEAQISGQLQHPGIIPVYDLGVCEDQRPFFSMKLVEGRTLAHLLKQRPDPTADLTRMLGVFEQICQTVAYAHARGVIHRDLKPANVMVGAFGEVQVMDWGLAKVLQAQDQDDTQQVSGDAETIVQPAEGADAPAGAEGSGSTRRTDTRTQVGAVLGTPAYMAPEQARGEIDRLDERCDVFGLGGILCNILTGSAPFHADSPVAAHQLAVAADMQPVWNRLDECGANSELISIVKRCLSVDLSQRLRDAGQVTAAITQYRESVADRLRQAEVDRAQAEVMVAEERKRREVEQARANEEQRRREAEQTAAREERKRRRMTLALAASLILLLSTAAAIGFWAQRQQVQAAQRAVEAQRQRVLAEQRIADALIQADEAAVDLENRLKQPGGVFKLLDDPTGWRARLEGGLADVQRAAAIAHATDGMDDEWTRKIERAKSRLDKMESARTLALRLEQIRLRRYDFNRRGEVTYAYADREYPSEFEAIGVPLEAGQEEAAARIVSQSPIKEQLLAALDQWALLVLVRANKALETDATEELREQGRLDEALQSARRAIQLLATDPGFYITLGNVLADQKQVAATRAAYEKSLKVDPEFSSGWFNLGMWFYEQKDLAEAEYAFRRSTEAKEPDRAALNNYGNVLRLRKKFPQAIAALRRAIELEPSDHQAWANLGQTHSDQRNWPEAEAAFRKSLEFDPSDFTTYNNLSVIYFRQRKLPEATAALAKALELRPKYAIGWTNLGNARQASGDREGAAKAYREAIKHNPKMFQPHMGLGLVLLELGQLDEALQSTEQSLALLPARHPGRAQIVNQAQRCRAAAALLKRLPEMLGGGDGTAKEFLQLAEVCLAILDRPADAATMYERAFAADPKLPATYRYNGACAAALAIASKDVKLSSERTSALREQALTWLTDELAAYRTRLESSPQQTAATLAELRRWQQDDDLAAVRELRSLVRMPAAPRKAWQDFWVQVEQLIQQQEAT